MLRCMAKRVFIIHGWGGDPGSNWFPWLKEMLEKRGMEAVVPRMPDSENPKLAAWLETLRKAVGGPDAETFMVGHSLGCITILRYMQGLGDEDKIGGAVLVAGFTEDLGIKQIVNFLDGPVDWKRINARCKRFVAIASDNDGYVPLRQSEILKEKLGAKVLMQQGMGHFNMAELHVALNELLKIIG